MGIFIFILIAISIVFTSIKLSIYADQLDNNTKIGSFIGGIILAGVTSLPELVSSLSATYIGNPYLTVGNIIGSNIFNFFIFALFDFLYIKKRSFNNINKKYIYICGLLIYLYLIIINAFLNKNIDAIFNPKMTSYFIIIIYFVFTLGLSSINKKSENEKKEIKGVLMKLIISIILMIGLSILLTLYAHNISIQYPFFKSSLIGAFLIGITTSLPELVTLITLFKVNNFNMAFANIIGSNFFNFLIFAITDIISGNILYNYVDKSIILMSKASLYILIFIISALLMKVSKSYLKYILPSLLTIGTYIYIILSNI